ncbi:HRDC domain-containing protein [Kineococcus gynurae]|uniref:HRDC domain-containing protein n=1 Tax=Kineococcus gynurae TaxID=452979 RepID=A0ABV5LV08_9ACTN
MTRPDPRPAPGSDAGPERPDDDATTEASAPEPPALPLLEAPAEGLPPLVETTEALLEAAARLAAGTGPVAVDAERASGYRYGQRAFLVQLRRAGSGTILVDPEAVGDLTPLGEALRGVEWILHAATQDLPCLAEVGMRPDRLFDTELGARLAGLPKVGLGAVVEELLGLRLAKEHSAVDWSTRPLPESWLTYAALDVEVLIPLRDEVAARLRAGGKLGWAEEEFAAIVAAPPPVPPAEPWRRTSGLHAVRSARQLAVVRELWFARDAEARRRDTSPGRLLPDSALVAAARATPRSAQALLSTPGFTGRGARSGLASWFAALQRGVETPEADLPVKTVRTDSPPPPRTWAARDPLAAARLAAARELTQAVAEELSMPVENLLQPEALRRLAWNPPRPITPESVAVTLAPRARNWQLGLLSVELAEVLVRAETEAATGADTSGAGSEPGTVPAEG